MNSYRNSPVIFVANREVKYYRKGDEIFLRDVNDDEYLATVHGAGWVDNILVTQASHLTRLNTDTLLSSALGASQKGVICTYIHSKNQSVVFPDPLGSCILFFYQKNGIFACATDLGELVDILKKHSIKLKKNLFFLTEIICTGSGGFFDSSYEDIQALEPHRYITIRDGQVQLLNYSTESILFEAPDFGVDRVKDDIDENIRAILEDKELPKIAHITGGFDSRLVFSALMKNGVKEDDNLFFLCNGKMRQTDKSVAFQLCGEFGQTMISDPRIIKNPNFTDNLLRYTHGLSLQHPPIAATAHELVIAGGFGENLRSFYSQAIRDDINEINTSVIIEKLYGSVLSEQGGNRFVSSQFYDQFFDRFEKKLSVGTKNGLSKLAAIDYLYISVRNRYFLSQTALQYTNVSPRVDPLYSLYGAGLALHMDAPSRQSNLLGLELMSLFSADCLALPFDRERVTGQFLEKHLDFRKKQFSGKEPKLLNPTLYSIQSDKKIDVRSATTVDIKKANAIGSPLWQIANMQTVQHKLKSFVASIDSAELSKNLNTKYIRYLCEQPLDNRVHIRRLFNIFNVLSWYYED